MSRRTAAGLSQKLKSDFLSPERRIEPLRAVLVALRVRSLSRSALAAEVPGLADGVLEDVLATLTRLGWVRREPETDLYATTGDLQTFVQAPWSQRIDGLNHQLDVVAQTMLTRLFENSDEPATARTWSLKASPAHFAALMEDVVKQLRHAAVDCEEASLKDAPTESFEHGVTIAPTPLSTKK